MEQGSFDELGSILIPAGVASNIAELHGTLSGVLCADPYGARAKWLGQFAADSGRQRIMSEACERSLERLFEATQSDLESSEMTFYPLLPDDNETLGARTRALALWCQGFLYGLDMGGLPDESELTPEIREVIGDFTEITRAEADEDENGEQAEQAYAELVEFVRVGVQLVFEELANRTPSNSGQVLH